MLTQYSDNKNNSNSVINLFFLQSNSTKLNNYEIHPKLCFPSDYASLTINIIINKKFIQVKWHTIIKNSKEVNFISDLIKGFKNINTSNIPNKDALEQIVQEYTNLLDST